MPSHQQVLDSTAVDRRVMEALDAGDFDRAATLLQKLALLVPAMEPVVFELLPALESLQRNDLDEALFRLIEETTWDSLTEDRLLEIAATKIEARGDAALAAVAWSRWRGELAGERGRAAAKKAGLADAEAIRVRGRDLAIAHYRARLARNADDAAAHERLGWNLVDLGDVEGGLKECARACDLDPQRRGAWQLTAEVALRRGDRDGAIRTYERAAEVNPGKAWPWIAIASMISEDDTDGAIAAAARGLEEEPTDLAALQLQRVLLNKGKRWQDLYAHLQLMTDNSQRLADQIALHEEMADLLAQKLNSPLEGVETRRRAEWLRDVPSVSASYWQMLAEKPDDPEIWAQVENFFRVNELWEELVKFLIKKAEQVPADEIPAIWDEVLLSYRIMPGADLEALQQMLLLEIARSRTPERRTMLEGLKARVAAEAAAAPAADVEQDGSTDAGGWVLYAIAAVVFVLAVVTLALGVVAVL